MVVTLICWVTGSPHPRRSTRTGFLFCRRHLSSVRISTSALNAHLVQSNVSAALGMKPITQKNESRKEIWQPATFLIPIPLCRLQRALLRRVKDELADTAAALDQLVRLHGLRQRHDAVDHHLEAPFGRGLEAQRDILRR